MQINIPGILAEVTAEFERYEVALTTNDIATLDEQFWASAHVIRYGERENLYGRDEIAAFRRARPSKGLVRALRRTVITTFGTDFATANTEFVREGKPLGRQSQAWARLPEGWRIVSAHVSQIAE